MATMCTTSTAVSSGALAAMASTRATGSPQACPVTTLSPALMQRTAAAASTTLLLYSSCQPGTPPPGRNLLSIFARQPVMPAISFAKPFLYSMFPWRAITTRCACGEPAPCIDSVR